MEDRSQPLGSSGRRTDPSLRVLGASLSLELLDNRMFGTHEARGPRSRLRWGRAAHLPRLTGLASTAALGERFAPSPATAAAARASHLDSVRPRPLKCPALPSSHLEDQEKEHSSRPRGEEPGALSTQTRRAQVCLIQGVEMGWTRENGPSWSGSSGDVGQQLEAHQEAV